MTNAKRKPKLEKAISSIEGVSKSSDGHLLFEHFVVSQAITSAQEIGNELVAQLMPFKAANPKVE